MLSSGELCAALQVTDCKPKRLYWGMLSSGELCAALQVTDCKPKRPNWGMLSSGEVHSTTIAAWGNLVLLGDADGNLNKWDTTT